MRIVAWLEAQDVAERLPPEWLYEGWRGTAFIPTSQPTWDDLSDLERKQWRDSTLSRGLSPVDAYEAWRNDSQPGWTELAEDLRERGRLLAYARLGGQP